MNKKAMIGRYFVLALSVVLIIVLIYFMFFNSKPKEISYSNDVDGDNQGLVQRIETGNVKALYIESYKVYALTGEPSQSEINAFYKNPTKKRLIARLSITVRISKSISTDCAKMKSPYLSTFSTTPIRALI